MTLDDALARLAALEREVAECIADMRRVQAEMVQEDVPGWPNSIEEWIARVQALEHEVTRLRGDKNTRMRPWLRHLRDCGVSRGYWDDALDGYPPDTCTCGLDEQLTESRL